MRMFVKEEMMHRIKLGSTVGTKARYSPATDSSIPQDYVMKTVTTIAKVDAIRSVTYIKKNGSYPIIKSVHVKCAFSDEWIPFEDLCFIATDKHVYEKHGDEWMETYADEEPNIP